MFSLNVGQITACSSVHFSEKSTGYDWQSSLAIVMWVSDDPVALLHIIRLLSCKNRSFVGSATKVRAVAAVLIRDGNRLLLHEPADSPTCEEFFTCFYWSEIVTWSWSCLLMIDCKVSILLVKLMENHWQTKRKLTRLPSQSSGVARLAWPPKSFHLKKKSDNIHNDTSHVTGRTDRMCNPVVIRCLDCPLVRSAVTGSQTAGDVAFTLELLFILFALLNIYRGVETERQPRNQKHIVRKWSLELDLISGCIQTQRKSPGRGISLG